MLVLNRSETNESQVALWQNKECTDMTRYAQNAAQTGSRKTAIHAASSSISETQCGKKHQEGAKHRFTDKQEAQVVKMCAEGMSLSVTARVMGAGVPTVNKWVKKGALATGRLTRFLEWRTSGRRDRVRASIMAFDEMWTYLWVRRGERRKYLWIWTAVVEEVRWRPLAYI